MVVDSKKLVSRVCGVDQLGMEMWRQWSEYIWCKSIIFFCCLATIIFLTMLSEAELLIRFLIFWFWFCLTNYNEPILDELFDLLFSELTWLRLSIVLAIWRRRFFVIWVLLLVFWFVKCFFVFCCCWFSFATSSTLSSFLFVFVYFPLRFCSFVFLVHLSWSDSGIYFCISFRNNKLVTFIYFFLIIVFGLLHLRDCWKTLRV